MQEEDWDFDTQYAETLYTCEHLRDKKGVKPHTEIMLDLFFVPIKGEENRKDACEKALGMFGYQIEDADEAEISVSVGPIPFTPQDIWLHEERTTKIALSRGYKPDGWGFAEAE